MRIVAGAFGGRKLHVPKDNNVRPTSDKIRGAIFNALGSRDAVEGATVMDVFCGTGALGLEALSRGAAGCTFIDKARSFIDLAQQNAHDLGADERSNFILKDAAQLSVRPDNIEAANLVFLDPPYEQGFIVPVLSILDEQGWLAQGAQIVLESEKGFLGHLPQSFQSNDERIYKDTKIIYASYRPGS